MLAFGIAAATIAVLMFALALTIGAAQQRTVEALKAAAPTVKRWGGRVLVLVGGWFVALGVFSDFFAEIFAL